MSRRPKAAVAMSGGVDSSVAAALLLERGYEVVGLTMDTGVSAGGETREARDARRAARSLGIQITVVDVAGDFKRLVADPFLEAYANGITPVPCAICNREFKFGMLLLRARALGAEFLASGHYARLGGGNAPFILRPEDKERDQTYFLYDIPREHLRYMLFPLGGLTKAQVRARARELGLPAAGKPASREVCFVGKGRLRDYLSRRLNPRPGPIMDINGRVLGEHGGIHFFTIGQRRGLGLGSAKRLSPAAKAMHVVSLDGPGNRVIVGPERELFSSSCVLDRVNLFAKPAADEEVVVKIRSGHAGGRARLHTLGGDAMRVEFLSPQRAVTPGQAAVFYRGEEMLGGGTILNAEKSVPAEVNA